MFSYLKKILNIEIFKKEKNENKNSAGGKNQIIINGKR